MLSINNFFGVDLEKMPNQLSIYKGLSYNTSGETVKDYFHTINPDCDNHYFDSLEIKVIANSATNFIFTPIYYSAENAVDIAFVIERDLFNSGNLKYMDYFNEHRKKFGESYFRFEWKFDKATIELSRSDDELALTVWSNYYHEIDKDIENVEIPSDAYVAEDGIIEYKFGSDLYPQGCEVSENDKDYIIPQSIEGVSFRTVRLRVSSTDERIRDTKIILENITRRKEIMFLGALLNGAFVFLDTENRIVFPMTEIVDRISLLQGKYISATAKHFDTENLSSYIGFTFQIMTTNEKK